jgi:hypothetical protein
MALEEALAPNPIRRSHQREWAAAGIGQQARRHRGQILSQIALRKPSPGQMSLSGLVSGLLN